MSPSDEKLCDEFIRLHWHVNYESNGLILASSREVLLKETIPLFTRRFYEKEFGCVLFDQERNHILCDNSRRIYCYTIDQLRYIMSITVGHVWYDGIISDFDTSPFCDIKTRVRCRKASEWAFLHQSALGEGKTE